MGIVAGNTLALFQGGMDTGLIQIKVLNLVANITDVVPFLLEQKFGYNTVGKVTLFTFPLFHNRMDIFFRKILLNKIRMTVHTLFALKLPFPAAKLSLCR